MTAGLISFTRGEDPLRADKLNSAFVERLLRSGDTMTGPLILSRNPVLPFEASTKQYIDGLMSAFSALGDAPLDGKSYGRATAAWSPVLPLTGGTLSGALTVNAALSVSGKTTTQLLVTNTSGNLGSGYTPVGSEAVALGWNLTNANGEVDFLNCYTAAVTRSFSWQQRTGSTWNEIAWLSPAGDFVAVKSVSVGISGTSSPTLQVTGAASSERQMVLSTNGATRWVIAANSNAESGSNNGTDLGISRFNDAGAFLSTPLSITRSTGLVSLTSGLSVVGLATITDTSSNGPLTVSNTGVNGVSIILVGNGATTPNKYVGVNNGNFRIINHAFTTELMRLTDAGVLSTLSYILGTGVYCNDTNFGLLVDATYKSLTHQATVWQNRFATATGTRTWTRSDNLTLMSIDAAGTFTIAGSGLKPGGGSWTDSSDARIKDVLSDYTQGLSEIVQLQPRNFRYRGNEQLISRRHRDAPDDAEMPEPDESPHATVMDREFIGLVAQEAETLFPEMVSRVCALIDGEEVDDMRVLDTTPLTYAMINAFKELDARLHRLEERA